LLAEGERSQLVGVYKQYRSMRNEWLRRQIKINHRVDILATEVLGYQVKPFHLKMLQFQARHPDNLELVFRGAGKSTLCDVAKTIQLLIEDRSLRIVLASRTMTQSEAFLKEIKGHLESNQLLAELFGPFYDPNLVSKWDNREIEILGRGRATKEASITCVGADGAVVGKHYDVEMSDDLVDEENSRTKTQRDKLVKWYYTTLEPCIEPPDADVPHRGERHRLGTRYHYDDLYGHWMNNELKDHHLIIPALDAEGRSPWPEKFAPAWFKSKREKSGAIIFNAQFLCDTEAMKGEVFQYDDCQVVDDDKVPKGLRKYMGVDLAISEADSADHFAIAVIGVDPPTGRHYVLEHYNGQLRFNEQTKKIIDLYEKHDPIRIGIESNGYQKAQIHNIKSKDKSIRAKGIHQDKDKMTRAMKLSALFEDKKMFFRRGMEPLIDQLVLFPGFRYKDLFDALDLAVAASRIRAKKRIRAHEPGLL
jgi:predicted phage terminase large subunit-like protein